MPIPVVYALIIAAVVQTQPNFTGTWTLIEVDGKAPASTAKPVVAVVAHKDKELAITIGTQTQAFTLDGSERIIQNSGPSGPVSVRVRARMVGRQFVMDQRSPTNTTTQTVSLSDDGTQMTVETVAQTPQGERREKQRFKKSAGY